MNTMIETQEIRAAAPVRNAVSAALLALAKEVQG